MWVAWEHHRRSKELSRALGFNLIVFDYNGLCRYLVSIYYTTKLFITNKPEIIVVQNPSMILAALACVYKHFFKYTYVIVDRHTTFRLNKKYRFNIDWIVYSVLNRFTLKQADLTIVTNKYLADIVIMNNGKPFILEDKLPDTEVDVKLELGSEKFKFMMISSFSEDEPIREVFKAFHMLLDEEVELYITGDFNKFPQHLIADKPKNVKLTGYLSDEKYLEYLNSVDATIVLTTADHCMLCGCYESISYKKPLITSNKRVLKEYFRGALFIENDPDSIVSGVISMIKNYDGYYTNTCTMRNALNLDWAKKIDCLLRLVTDATGHDQYKKN